MKNNLADIKLFCRKCRLEYSLGALYYKCPHCGKALNIREEEKDSLRTGEGRGIFRYSQHLIPNVPYTTLGEGGTPLHLIEEDGRMLYFKLEYLNPSGSFKDRGAALTIAVAKGLGVKEVNEDSSGNAGTAIALYARAYGIKPNIFMPMNAPENKKLLVRLFGGNLILGKNRGDANKLAIEDAEDRGVYYVGHVWNPFFIMALKTVAYEVYEEGVYPDEVFIPVGSGGLYLGMYHGFKELYSMGLIERIPRMHAVEAAGYERIYPAVNGEMKYPRETSDLADGLRVPGPPRMDEILEALNETGGHPHVVNDSEIIMALKKLYEMGLFVEPTSATAYAAYIQAHDRMEKDEEILIPLTGSGFKALDKIIEILPEEG